MARLFKAHDVVAVKERTTIRHSDYVAHLGDHVRFTQQVAARIGAKCNMIALGDGARWIWEFGWITTSRRYRFWACSIAKTVTVSAAAASVAAPVDINIASPNPPAQNIDVTVGVDQAALTAYNATQTTKYTILPTTAYQLTTPTVTVAVGQRIATVNVSFVGNKVPATGGPFALPLTIQSTSNNVAISANYKTQILIVSLTK